MTTTTDSAGHPDVAEISDLTEGLLSPSRTLDVRRHLDDCPLCTDVYESLEEIRGMLGTLPGPSRMPTDVAERIDAALAAEALLDATAVSTETLPEPSPAAAVPSGEPSPATAASSIEPSPVPSAELPAEAADAEAAHVSRETSPPSSARTATGPAGHSRAATGPGRGSRLRRHRRRTAVLGAVFTAAALGLGTLLIQPWSDDSKDSPSSASTDADSTFARSKLEGRVTKLLASERDGGREAGSSRPSYGVKSSPGEEPSKGSTMREDYVTVPPCIERGLGGRTPLAADKGTYEGQAAYLVVVPHDSDGAKVSAYVVDAACVSASAAPDATGKVLLTESYARP